MWNLKTAIKHSFEEYYSNSPVDPCEYNSQNYLYMNVPAFKDTFEIPVFLLQYLTIYRNLIHQETPDSFTVFLNYKNLKSSYKSLSSQICSLLVQSFPENRLIRICLRAKEAEIAYYITHGAIFNKDFFPIMMMSWKYEKIPSEDTTLLCRYKPVQPILRISPSVFTDNSDSVTRFIINHILSTALECRCFSPHIYHNDLFIRDDTFFDIKVDIGNFPFSFTKANAPSVSTTNEELLNVALNNIDEILE